MVGVPVRRLRAAAGTKPVAPAPGLRCRGLASGRPCGTRRCGSGRGAPAARPGGRRRPTGNRCRWRRAASSRPPGTRSEEHTSELQSLMRISYAVFCLKKKKTHKHIIQKSNYNNDVPQEQTEESQTHMLY